MKNKENVIDADAKVEQATEKKPGFFSKLKSSVSDQVLDVKIANAYKKDSEALTVYTKGSLFPKSLNGKVDGLTITVWGDDEIKPYSVLVVDETLKAYYVISSKKTKVTAVVDGIEYERDGQVITVDDNVEEVNVVKAGDHYYIYKGK